MRVLRLLPFAAICCALALLLPGCSRSSSSEKAGGDHPSAQAASTASAASSTATPAPAGTLDLDVVFSSEKKEWATEAFSAFDAQGVTVADGRRIRVRATFGGSIEPIEGLVAGRPSCSSRGSRARRCSSRHGFRPGNLDVPVVTQDPDNPFNGYKDMGVRIDVPRIATPPEGAVLQALLQTFQRNAP